MLHRYMCILITTAAGMFPLAGNANIYSTIERAVGLPTDVTYHFVIYNWDNSDSYPNPCYGQYKCKVAVSHRHLDSDTPAGVTGAKYFIDKQDGTTEVRTTGQLAKIWKKKYGEFPLRDTEIHRGKSVVEECVGIVWAPADMGPGKFLPGSVCGFAPPPIGHCEFRYKNIVIDHKIVSGGESSTAREDMKVVCNQPTSVLVSLLDSNVKLIGKNIGTLNSRLTLSSGGKTGDSINLGTVGINGKLISVESLLNVPQTANAGEYTGSTVILIAMP
ncbi:hypothetical protein NLN86_24280 [Citrobacter portucalensis]|uniref:Adhesin n=1 Tax=Citrobacter portucalensis TaxID=1639133 RepID=A0AAW5WFG4_9ENTR|nr:hypothetical protein [Citrobacter portucalensis]MCX9004733.1 hypothetical protein [Citrobacter portucalensis]